MYKRQAINTIKDRVAGMNWRIQPRRGRVLGDEMKARIQVLTETLEQPNPDDSFRSFSEQVLEDIIVGGYGAVEMRLTGNEQKPLALFPVDGATIQMRAEWNGDPDQVRYVQMGPLGMGKPVELKDRELSYIRLNPRSYTPFGLGRLEVAFETIHEFLGAHRFAAKPVSYTHLDVYKRQAQAGGRTDCAVQGIEPGAVSKMADGGAMRERTRCV